MGMHGWKGAVRTLVSLLISLFLASVLIFTLIRMLPGDTAAATLGVGTTPEQLQQLREELGTDQPVWTQYGTWLHDLFTGQTVSLVSKAPLSDLLSHRLAITVPLSLGAFFLAVVISVPLGVLAAMKRRSPLGVAISAFSQVGLAVPVFWVGVILVWVFALTLGWFPSGNFPRTGWETPGQAIWALTLPAFTIAIVMSAVMVRYIRSSVLDVLDTEYMRTARSLGQSRWQAFLRHGLRNAAVPVVAILGIELGTSLLGAVVVENVFALPGLGQLLLQSTTSRDLPIVQNLVMLLTAVVLILNALVDTIQRSIDPRLRQEEAL
ncbi:ABC transporter permease [Scrofimicrobium canadense]|nr:ABC transporter permease [Scrofimicrobium canadense]